MFTRKRNFIGAAFGMASALCWALAMLAQNAAEPFNSATGGTYWLRDVRWLALLATAVAVVWTFHGDRFMAAVASLGFSAGIGLDIVVDRLNATGAVALILLLSAAWFVGFKRDIRPSKTVSMMTAGIGGSGVFIVAMLESNGDNGGEWVLLPSIVLLGAVLSLMSLGCAFDAGEDCVSNRFFAIVALLGIAVLLAATRMEHIPTAFIAAVGVLCGSAGAVSLISMRPKANIFLAAAVAMGTVCAAVVSIVVATMAAAWSNVAAPFTWLAGNPAVAVGQYDLSTPAIGLVAGLGVGVAVLAGRGVTKLFAKRTLAPSAV